MIIPLLYAIALSVVAASIGVFLLWLALPRPRWRSVDYACGTKKQIGIADTSDLVTVRIERDESTGEERAWLQELQSGKKTYLSADSARRLIATFTHLDKE